MKETCKNGHSPRINNSRGECRQCKRDSYNVCNRRNQANQEWRANNLRRRKEKAQLNKKRAVEFLGGRCKHCGLVDSNLCIYDFHHIDPTQKELKIGGVLFGSWDTVVKELVKCILLCANCHRKVHFEAT